MPKSNEKKWVGEKAAEWVENGMTIGLGTGSTAYYFTQEIARKIKEENLQIKALTSSSSTRELATQLNIPLISTEETQHIDLYVDGADEIDPQKNLIKGAGGAMVQEKILASSAKEFIVIADSSKIVDNLCTKFPIPVEFIPMARSLVFKSLTLLGANPVLRMQNQKPYQTDQGNYIADALFETRPDPVKLDVDINNIPGVLGHGLFIGLAQKIITTKGGEIQIY